jgi:hypothetical protein
MSIIVSSSLSLHKPSETDPALNQNQDGAGACEARIQTKSSIQDFEC